MQRLKGKVALVTGGNSGIGLACAERFADEGAKVIVTASTPKSFEKAQGTCGKIWSSCKPT